MDMSRAIAALRQARLRIEALERDRRVPIAVVGMGCRLPGASDLDAYWSLLRAGGDAIREVPPERWSLAEYYDADPRAPGRAASRHGGFVDGIFDFDRERFGISQAEAEVMDPQQRLLLEVAAEAFERAGDADLAGSRTGVFVGISTHDFALRAIRDEATEKIGVYSGTGSASAITLIYPELKGRLNGHAVRVPLLNASLTDCVFEVERETSAEAVNALFRAASEGPLKGILGFETRPLVSSDFTNDPRSSIIDGPSTLVVNGTQVKVFAWYDNEWGYACRLADIARMVAAGS